jgi:TolB-like protein
MLDTQAGPDRRAIEEQLHRILDSKLFVSSHRSQDFLRYVVDKSLAGFSPKEYAIAVDVFERGTDYDPAVDATVRVEAGRLRSRLREYYETEGKFDPVCISIPKGSYAAVFSVRESQPEPRRPFETTVAAVVPPGPPELPAKRRSPWRVVAMGALVFLLVSFSAWQWRRSHVQKNVPPTHEQRISLAVLPFVNETGDPANDYVISGLTDNLIRQLSEVRRLKLIARSAVYRFPSGAQNALSIGRTLGINTVLAGEVRRMDGKLVVNIELSNVKDGSILESRQYLPESLDLRPVQASVIQDVIRGLNLDLDARQSALSMQPVSTSLAAYQAYLRGENESRGDSPVQIHRAIHDFEEAVRLDPRFSLAWADLAQAHLFLAVYFEDPRKHMPLASQYAENALRLDSTLREAHGTLGLVALLYDWDYATALAQLSSADSQQSAMTVLSCTSHLLYSTGNTRAADELVHRMLGYDPQSPALVAELGCIDYYRGDYDHAIKIFREAITMDPGSPLPYWGLGKSLSLLGNYDAAVRTMRQFQAASGFEPPVLTAEIGYALAQAGHRKEAEKEIDQLTKESRTIFVDPYFIALIYLGMHDETQTFRWLDEAYLGKSPFLISMITEPKWKGMLKQPKLQHFLAKLRPNSEVKVTQSPRSS